MKKTVLLGVLALGVLMLGQPAWASGGHYRHNDDDLQVFRKVIHVLDDVFNDSYKRGSKTVVIKTTRYPQRICRVKHTHRRGGCELAYNRGHGKKYGHYNKHSKHHRGSYQKVCKLYH